ncbi:MAG: glycosyltransferase family 1 protein [Chlorobi bacterium]|nr:glycosyltransferase family 1 protein [Chlorobiota bacterium]
MLVCHVAGTAQRGQDGVTRVLYEYLERHRVAGLEPLVITAVADAHEREHFPMIEMSAIRLPLYRDYKLYTGTATAFEQTLDQYGIEPDVIHIHTPCPLGRAALRYVERRGIPAIATYHTHFPSYMRHHRIGVVRPFLERALAEFYRRCDRVLVPSRMLCDWLSNLGVGSARYLPHGTDIAMFNPQRASLQWRQRLGISPERTVLLYVGRLVWEKNLRVLVDVWGRLDRRRYAMVVVGTGPIQSRLRRLMPDALFLGYRSGIELATAYASSDVFVFPSDTETFGNVTLEALASGLPCVVADAPGSAELVRHGATGFRIEARDSIAFADAIETLAAMSRERKLLWRMRARVDAESYQWSSICSELFGEYRQLLHERREASTMRAQIASLSSP